MTLITIIIAVGLLAALAGRSVFPASRLLGWSGMLVLGLSGSAFGGVVSPMLKEAGRRLAYSPSDIWWSTLGAVGFVAIAAVMRKAELSRALPPIGQPDEQ